VRKEPAPALGYAGGPPADGRQPVVDPPHRVPGTGRANEPLGPGPLRTSGGQRNRRTFSLRPPSIGEAVDGWEGRNDYGM